MSVLARVKRLERVFPEPAPPSPYLRYRDDPVGFARDVLRVRYITPVQEAIAKAILEPPYRVLVPAAHGVGKTFTAAWLALWWHLTRVPSIVLTTAPKFEQVQNLLWKEIRRLARPLRLRFDGPKTPCRTRAADDFMLGTTAATGTAFQGHHGDNLFFWVDEAVGVRSEIMEVIETMFAGYGHVWGCIYNPTASDTAVYRAEQARDAAGRPLWTRIPMSAIDHPNIAAELAGEPPPIPSAIRLGRLNDLLAEWCEPVRPGSETATDLCWPPRHPCPACRGTGQAREGQEPTLATESEIA